MYWLVKYSSEIKEYEMGNRYCLSCAIVGFFILYYLQLSTDKIILGYLLVFLAGIDIIYKEIPNDATELLIIVALFSLPKITIVGALVYFIFIITLFICNLTGGLGGGDFKLYCSMLIITPGFEFLLIMMLCALVGVGFYILSGFKSKSLPMVPVILVSFIFTESLKLF